MGANKLYFGYGSNLWQEQMTRRCPNSPFVGIARLARYRWQINDRGYANVVETGNAVDEVWGLVYALPPADEATLDVNEGVPVAYEKRMLDVEFWDKNTQDTEEAAVTATAARSTPMLVYIDYKRKQDSSPKAEYIYRMNQGIRDAVKEGVPERYVTGVLRAFIPDQHDEGVREEALQQAGSFVDDNTL